MSTQLEKLQKELEKARAEIKRLESVTDELQRLKDELKNSEERYRAAFEYTGTAMIVINDDMTVIMANHKVEEITGYAQEESRKQHKWTEFVAPDDRERMIAFHNKRREHPESVPGEYEFRLIDQNNNVRDMLCSATLLPDSGKSLISLVDITRLKKSERALRESEKKYRELFENANDIIYTIDLEGNFTSANKSALETYGYSRDDILKTNIRQLIDPDHIQTVMEKIADKISHSTASPPYELLTRTRNGKPVWVEVSARLIRDDDRNIGIQGIARDITERKRHEEQLRESQERFKEIADLLPGIICELDTTMRLTYMNEMGLTSFGLSEADFEKGISAWDWIPEDELEHFTRDVFNVTHGDFGNPKLYELFRKDHSRMQLIVNSAPIRKNGVVVGIRSCLIDISDRVRAEIKLRESEERFRSVYESSPIGIALYDTAGTLLDSNNSFREMYPVDHEVFSKPLFTLVDIGADALDKLQNGSPVSLEHSLKKNRNAVRYFEWHISAVKQPESPPFMYLVQVQDITERKEFLDAQIQQEREATAKAQEMIADLQRELKEYTGFNNIISRSPEMKKIFDILPELSYAAATVLISGDSGTGKELIARSLHEQGNRKNKPFIAINCSALPDTLLESELFGYKAGAFTDAKKDKPGRFALAEGGTIFLDEIGDISGAMQVKLLRVLQERLYEPLGGTETIKADVRILAATNKNLSEMVAQGTFREDLYYRINIVTLMLPPLRKRRCDIPLLCKHFIERFNTRYNKTIVNVSNEALEILMAHEFPGNIRELENIIEHAFIFCNGTHITACHLPSSLQKQPGVSNRTTLSKIKNLTELERIYVKSILTECGGNRITAAERLGIHRATLFRKMKQLGIG
jgi:PAS domain S-box-containing protein